MLKDDVIDFCLECTIPGVLKAYSEKKICKRKELLINAVVLQAYKDANRGARTDRDGSFGDAESRTKTYLFFQTKLSAYVGDGLSSNEMIKQLNDLKTGASHAFIQKLVNMTLKYILVLQELKNGIPDIIVREEMCECPIDSIIMNAVKDEIKMNLKEEKKELNFCWTQQKESEYERVQKVIRQLGYDNPIDYDFTHWKH